MSENSLDELFEEACQGAESESEREEIKAVKSGLSKSEAPKALMEEGAEPSAEQIKDMFQQIKDMSVAEKIKLALTGNKTARAILIKDSSKQIPGFTLQNPGITSAEITNFAKDKNTPEMVFRMITRESSWMKDYEVKKAICSNPKVPIDVSMKWLKYLREKDLRNLGRSKGLPQAVAAQCRKLVEKRRKK